MPKDHEQIKKEIREHATTLFLEKGYKGATMRQIATACGMPLSSLQYYYDKKIKIFQDIVSPMIANTEQLLKKMIQPKIENGFIAPQFINDLALLLEDHIAKFTKPLILTMRESRGTPYEGRSQFLLEKVKSIIPPIINQIAGKKVFIDKYKEAYITIIAQMVIDLMVSVAQIYEPEPWARDILHEGALYSYKTLEKLAQM